MRFSRPGLSVLRYVPIAKTYLSLGHFRTAIHSAPFPSGPRGARSYVFAISRLGLDSPPTRFRGHRRVLPSIAVLSASVFFRFFSHSMYSVDRDL